MQNKKLLKNTITSLEDLKGLYTQLEQSETDTTLKQNLQKISDELEQQYHFLNSLLKTVN